MNARRIGVPALLAAALGVSFPTVPVQAGSARRAVTTNPAADYLHAPRSTFREPPG